MEINLSSSSSPYFFSFLCLVPSRVSRAIRKETTAIQALHGYEGVSSKVNIQIDGSFLFIFLKLDRSELACTDGKVCFIQWGRGSFPKLRYSFYTTKDA